MNRLSADDLRTLRDEVEVWRVLETLGIPTRGPRSHRRFRCPDCGGFRTVISNRRNLARCFHCATSFNSIDLVMATRNCSFLEAVDYLETMIQ